MNDTPSSERSGAPRDPGTEYRFIRAWGELLGSREPCIRDQIARARTENAPPTAIYRTQAGTWATTEDITRSTTRRELGLDPLPVRAPEVAELTVYLRTLLAGDEYLREVHGLHEASVPGIGRVRMTFTTGHYAHLDVSVTEDALSESGTGV